MNSNKMTLKETKPIKDIFKNITYKKLDCNAMDYILHSEIKNNKDIYKIKIETKSEFNYKTNQIKQLKNLLIKYNDKEIKNISFFSYNTIDEIKTVVEIFLEEYNQEILKNLKEKKSLKISKEINEKGYNNDLSF